VNLKQIVITPIVISNIYRLPNFADFTVLWYTHFAQHVGIDFLEYFIKAEFAQSLQRVADRGGSPALGQRPEAFLLDRQRKSRADAFVLGRVHLWKCMC